MSSHLIVAMTGASGAYATQLLLERSLWPTMFIASKWGRQVYVHECGPIKELEKLAGRVFDNGDMTAPPASGSVPTAGMVIVPCSAHTMGRIAAGLGDTLISRAAHCQLKERRPLIIGLRETPLTAIDVKNAGTLASAGATLMPLSPPFYMFKGLSPQKVTMHDLMTAYVDRVLSILGRPLGKTWEDVR
jgi:4-hydroxy-3-polyprenylbenzoate decarboxylase